MDQNIDIKIASKLIGDGLKMTAAGLDAIQKAAGSTNAQLKSTSATIGQVEQQARKTSSVFTGFIGAQAALGVIRQGWDAIKTAAIGMNSTLETSELQFTTLMGNADRAHQHVQDLFEIAKKTPFETGPIIAASKTLEVMGGAALNTKANIILLGDTAAATGAPIDELSMWTGRLYASLQAGKPFGEAAENLRRLGVYGPEIAAKMDAVAGSGKSAAEKFKVFTDYLQRYGGAMEKQAGTWQGVVSTFKDTAALLAADVFRPAFEAIKGGLDDLNAWLSSNDAQRWVRDAAAFVQEDLIPAVADVGARLKNDVWPIIQTIGSGGVRVVKDLLDTWKGLPDPIKDAGIYLGTVATALWGINSALTAIKGSALIAALLGAGGGAAGGAAGASALLGPLALLGAATVGTAYYGGRKTEQDLFATLPRQRGLSLGLSPEGPGGKPLYVSDAQLAAALQKAREPLKPGESVTFGGGAGQAPPAPPPIDKNAENKLKSIQKALKELGFEWQQDAKIGLDLQTRVEEHATAFDKAAIEAKRYGVTVPSAFKAAYAEIGQYRVGDMLRESQKDVQAGLHDLTVTINTEDQKAYEASLELFEKRAQAEFDYQDKIARAGMDATEQRLLDIDRAERAQIKSLGGVRLPAVTEYYEHERDLALGTADTIEERMAQQGVYTRDVLDRSAATAKRDYQQMLASGKYTAEQLEEAWRRWRALEEQAQGAMVERWRRGLSTLSSIFSNWGQSAGGALSTITQAANATIGVVEIAISSTAKMGDKLSAGFGTAAQVVGQYAGASAIAAMATGALSGAAAGATLAQLASIGATTAAGAAFMGVGAAVGALIGVYGYLSQKQAQYEAEVKQANQTLAQYKAKLVDTAGSLEDLFAISQVVGVDLKGYWDFTGTWGLEVFTDQMNAFTAAQEALVKSVDENAGLASQKLRDLMAVYMQTTGDTLDTAKQWYTAQLKSSAEGLSGVVASFKQSVGEDPFLTSQQQAAGLGAAIAGTFAELISRGATFKEAFSTISEPLATMRTELENTGFSGGSAFAFLGEMGAIATDKVKGPLADAISFVNQSLQGLHNSGVLNQEMFSGLALTATDAFTRIIADGGNSTAALAMMQPTLQTIWKLQKDFGYAVDEATQKLLDEATASGIVGDKAMTDAEKQTAALQTIADQMGVLVDFFKKLFPSAVKQGFEEATKAATDFSGTLDALDARRSTKYGFRDPTDVGYAQVEDYAARGGFVTPNGVRYFKDGGPVGTDTIPAWLSPGEVVFPAPAVDRIGLGTLETLARRPSALQASQPIVIHVQPAPVNLYLDRTRIARQLTEPMAYALRQMRVVR